MAEQNFCQNCHQKHNCSEIYRQLGHIKGPSVVLKAVTVFLLPLVVFIVTLTAFEKIFAWTKELQTTLGFLMALSVTVVFVVGCSLLTSHRNKYKK